MHRGPQVAIPLGMAQHCAPLAHAHAHAGGAISHKIIVGVVRQVTLQCFESSVLLSSPCVIPVDRSWPALLPHVNVMWL
jgi:hypothetical protein